jgi:hypothetical protein
MADVTERDWQLRLVIYQFFVDNERPPTADEAARLVGISPDEAVVAYRRLHDAHALLLDRDTGAIRIANPLSAIPTDYRVRANGHEYYANCAWDSLGVPAMLHADATIEATIADDPEPMRYAIENGELRAEGGGGIVHFPLPFRHWYDDLVHT